MRIRIAALSGEREREVNAMTIEPARDAITVELFSKEFYDHANGVTSVRRELSAFFGSNSTGWAPMVAVWQVDANDPSSANEDTVTINGSTYAYCTSDQEPSDFDGLEPIIGPSYLSPYAAEAMVAGLIYERVRHM